MLIYSYITLLSSQKSEDLVHFGVQACIAWRISILL